MSAHETNIRQTPVSAKRYAYKPWCSCGWQADWQSTWDEARELASEHERTAP